MDKYNIIKELFRSGTSIDGRKSDPRMVKELYRNTKNLLYKNDFLIPIKSGHSDNQEELKGRLINVELKKQNGNYRIFGHFEIYDQLQ